MAEWFGWIRQGPQGHRLWYRVCGPYHGLAAAARGLDHVLAVRGLTIAQRDQRLTTGDVPRDGPWSPFGPVAEA